MSPLGNAESSISESPNTKARGLKAVSQLGVSEGFEVG